MNEGADFIKWVGQALVVGLGWLVVHKLSSARDRDKARREMVAKSVDGLAETLNALFLEVRTYHLNARDVACELKIKMTLQDMAMRAIALSDICSEQPSLAQCRADIASLRRAITGKHFEDEHTGQLTETDPQFQLTVDATLRTKRSLLTLKHRQFPPK